MATAKKELRVKHFSTPELLCEWVNESNIVMVSIVPWGGSHAVYYNLK